LSAIPDPAARRSTDTREAVAGLLATLAIFAAAVGVVHRPVRLIPVAVVLALVAARMTTRHSRLAGLAIAIVVVCWVLGMTIAVITERPLY